jgi:hypothetical protein
MLLRLQKLTLIASGLFVAACGDSPDQSPTSPEYQLTSGPPCTPSTLKQYARALAGTNNPIYNLAQQFSTQNANTVFATNLFFDLAAELAAMARSGSLSDAQKNNLSNLLIQGIACAAVTISPDANYSGLSYTPQFVKAAGPTGALEVRGRTVSENDPVYSHNRGQNGAAGLKAPSEGFKAWYPDRVMFYGFPIDGFSDEAAPVPNAGRIAFEWFTVRPSRFSLNPDDLRGQVALCVTSEVSSTVAKLRVQHSETILPVGSFAPDDPCSVPSPFTVGASQPGSRFSGALNWLAQQLSPEPLHATTVLVTTSPTGRPKTLSPIEVINPQGAILTYEPVPSDGSVSQGLGVTVHATGTNSTNWEGLLIKLTAQDNNGRFVAVSPDTATTNEVGVADFRNSRINKPGVYQLLAVTQPGPDQDATGFAADSVLSSNFHRNPK